MKNSLTYLCIRINQFCNLHCVHCRSGSNPVRHEEIDFKKTLALVDNLMLHGLNHVNLTGGEPSLHSRFYDLVNELLIRDLYVTVTTNGLTAFSTKKLNYEFDKIERLRVRVSIDGNKKCHEALRGTNTFDKTLASLSRMSCQGIWIAVNTVIFEDTLNCMAQLFEVLKPIRINEWALISPVVSRNNEEFNSEHKLDYTNSLANLNAAKVILEKSGYSGEIHLIDFYSYPNTYLFVDEYGNISLPGVFMKDDVIISNLNDYCTNHLLSVVNQVIETNSQTFFNWVKNEQE